MNVASVFEHHLATSSAIVSRGVTTTYGELQMQVAAMRGALDGLGVGKGDRVALLCGNTIEFVVAYFACLGRGIVCVPLNPTAPAPELQRELSVVGARAVVVRSRSFGTWASCACDRHDARPRWCAAVSRFVAARSRTSCRYATQRLGHHVVHQRHGWFTQSCNVVARQSAVELGSTRPGSSP